MLETRVLVVEDEGYLREMVVEILCEGGYPAIGIGDPHEALIQTARMAPELIVLDMWMPTMNGRMFIDRLRDDPRFSDVPVLVVTGDSSFAHEASGYQHVRFLPKPFEASTLVDLTRELIGPPQTPSS
jgi:CheY-like chemotaxis protein